MKKVKKKRKVANVRVELKSNGIPDLKHNHYSTLQAARQSHDKLTYLFELRHATRTNVQLAAQ